MKTHFYNSLLIGAALVAWSMMTTMTTAEDLPITGKEVPQLQSLGKLLAKFVKDNDAPGASLAVAYKGKVVYARGFGYSDVEKKEPVQPTSLFRIASISKPITSVAIFQLIEQKKIKLDDRIFDIIGIEPFIEEGKTADPRVKEITIYHCLTQTAGWDRDKSYDAMFEPDKIAKALKVKVPPEGDDILRFMQGQPLDFDPSKRFAYSNLTYLALGRVIEKVTGKTYHDYIQENVLKPIGITDMKLGRSLLEDRAANEVKYYSGSDVAPCVVGKDIGKDVPEPYGPFYFEPMAAHGGWLATGADLAKFASSFENPSQCKLIKADSIKTMFTRPAGDLDYKKIAKNPKGFYACGWLVEPQDNGGINVSHAGALDGTSTNMMHRQDDITFAILFNSRMSKVPTDPQPSDPKQQKEEPKPGEPKPEEKPKFKDLRGACTPLLQKALDEIKSWPTEEVK